MLYTNLEFGFFFLAFFVIYWAIKDHVKGQNLLILAASYFFYGWWDWRFLGLIAFSSLTDYFVGIKLDDDEKNKKLWLYLSLAVNLGLLGVFKYYNFFVDSFIDLFALFNYELPRRTLQIILPVGISFYTFQTLSYSIDIYRGKVKHTRDIVSFLAFVSFFPQLIAGPIERASTFLPQFGKKREFDIEKAKDGIRQILWGLFKKVVIADTIAQAVGTLLGNPELFSGIEVFIGMFLFTVQLYCDFSGYSDIAIGLGKLLGFKLMTNFKYPIFAPDMLQFWSRYHISMTTWFRDYVYVTISGGSIVRDKYKMLRNFIFTFAISGLWHGANWTYVIWGVLEGIYQAPELLWKKFRAKKVKAIDAARFRVPPKHYFRVALRYSLNILSLVFFVSPSISAAGDVYEAIFSLDFFSIPSIFRNEFLIGVGFLAFEWVNQHKEYPLKSPKLNPVFRWSMYYAVVFAILYFNYERAAFIYFQF